MKLRWSSDVVPAISPAFEPLVEKYRQRVYRLAYNVLRDPEEAWDVAQEVFIRAYQALPTFRGESAFYTWLYRIVMNVAATAGDRTTHRAARSVRSACPKKTGSGCCPTRIPATSRRMREPRRVPRTAPRS